VEQQNLAVTSPTHPYPRCLPTPASRAAEARRSALRAALRWAAPLLLAGCMSYRPAVPPSEGHLSSESVVPAAEKASILPPVTATPLLPPPQARAKPTTYSVVVHEVPVKELLLALARDTKENIDIHPGLQGLVSLNAIDETLPAILERIGKQVNMRYRVEGRTIVVSPDTPFLKTYKVNYVNMVRETTSSISVSGQIGTTSGDVTIESGGKSETAVKSSSKNDFWELLRQNVESILASSRALTQTADQRQARAEAARAAREERMAQAEAVARAGQGAKDLFDKAFGGESAAARSDLKQDIIVNQVAGTLTVMATERQHGLLQQYLDMVQASVQRQVLIEATIAEVELSNSYQAGVDWSALTTDGSGINIGQELMGNDILTGAPRAFVGYVDPNSVLGNLSISLRLLERFGKTRVLSSPKLMALNNQTALLKVVDNRVYFTTEQKTSQSQSSTIETITTIVNTVAVGVIVSLTPQVHDNGSVTLTVRPTISRILGFKQDPNPLLTAAPNLIPEITVREMESVLQLTSGQTAVLGGLMQDSTQRNRDQVPYAGNLPRVGDAFAYRDEEARKSELVIFIRPVVVSNPSLDSDELKHLRKLLPEIDQTGQNP
jgi:MSHA type pilus biogenesis protein MshL